MTPEAIEYLARTLSKLPSLGPRQATRLSFYLAGLSRDEILQISEAVKAVAYVKRCVNCFCLQSEQGELCDICSNPRRDQTLVAIVEKETGMQSIEKAKSFNGRYLLIGELPKDGVWTSEHKRRIERLKETGSFEEIILAVSPTTYGDLAAQLLTLELKNSTKKITRLGRGIPTGAEIEFADEDTLLSAFKNREEK